LKEGSSGREAPPQKLFFSIQSEFYQSSLRRDSIEKVKFIEKKYCHDEKQSGTAIKYF